MSEVKLNLYQKIQAVANQVMSVEKDMEVGKGANAYKAVSDISVTIAVKKAELEFGIISIPEKQDVIHQEIIKTIKDGYETIKYSFIVKMTTKIVDLEDTSQFIEIESIGHGLDSGDKGFGKASTYARKYALLNAYKIATGEDPDKDPSETQKGIQTPSEKKISVLDILNLNNNLTQQVLQNFNIGSLDDLTGDMIERTYSMLKKRNHIV